MHPLWILLLISMTPPHIAGTDYLLSIQQNFVGFFNISLQPYCTTKPYVSVGVNKILTRHLSQHKMTANQITHTVLAMQLILLDIQNITYGYNLESKIIMVSSDDWSEGLPKAVKVFHCVKINIFHQYFSFSFPWLFDNGMQEDYETPLKGMQPLLKFYFYYYGWSHSQLDVWSTFDI